MNRNRRRAKRADGYPQWYRPLLGLRSGRGSRSTRRCDLNLGKSGAHRAEPRATESGRAHAETPEPMLGAARKAQVGRGHSARVYGPRKGQGGRGRERGCSNGGRGGTEGRVTCSSTGYFWGRTGSGHNSMNELFRYRFRYASKENIT